MDTNDDDTNRRELGTQINANDINANERECEARMEYTNGICEW